MTGATPHAPGAAGVSRARAAPYGRARGSRPTPPLSVAFGTAPTSSRKKESIMTEARIKANRKWNEKAYDRIGIYVKKGDKERIKSQAESKGLSMNEYITRLIYDSIDNNQNAMHKL